MHTMIRHELELIKNELNRGLFCRDIDVIKRYIGLGNNINTDVGFRVFDILLSVNKPETEEMLATILGNPRWNPNYHSADMWHPEERAMIHHREDLAIKIIQHPNFNKEEYPRVIQRATDFNAGKVLEFLTARTRS